MGFSLVGEIVRHSWMGSRRLLSMGTWEQGSPMRHAFPMKRWAKFWMDGVPWMSLEGMFSVGGSGVGELATKMTQEGSHARLILKKTGPTSKTYFWLRELR